MAGKQLRYIIAFESGREEIYDRILLPERPSCNGPPSDADVMAATVNLESIIGFYSKRGSLVLASKNKYRESINPRKIEKIRTEEV